MRRAAWMALMAGMGMVVVGAQGARAQKAVPVAMESLAQAYLDDGPDCARAAATYARAAAVRPADDVQAVQDLRLAGLLFANAGKLRQAADALSQAGQRALALGSFAVAADVYTNAAYVAAMTGNPEARVLAHRALWLADQAGVPEGERTLIRQRLAPAMVAYNE